MKRFFTIVSTLALLMVNFVASPTPTQANQTTVITVTTTTDELNTDGDCSLREAITAANTDVTVDACPAGSGKDSIAFSANVTGSISIGPANSPLPSITDSVSIIGPGISVLQIYLARTGNVLSFGGSGKAFSVSGLRITGLGSSSGGISMGAGSLTVNSALINNNQGSGGMRISGNAVVTITNSTIANNNASAGGGIYNLGGTLVISNSTISNNGSGFGGGGIYNTTFLTNTGNIHIYNSTISSNNTGNPGGGGIYNYAVLQLVNVSVISNTTTGPGGGLYVYTGTVTMQNSLVANSISSSECSQANGVIINGGYNIIEDNSCGFTGGSDPLVGPLQDNGGPTLTHALLPGSPAIDAGNPAGCADALGNPLTTDQRGYLRPVDGDGNSTAICDIGAYEYGSSTAADLTLTQTDTPDPLLFGNPLTYTVVVANIGPGDVTGVVLTDTLPMSVTLGLVTPSQGSCTGTSQVVCSLGGIASNASATVTLIVTPTATGLLNNMVTVTGNEFDPTLPNTDIETTLVANTIYSLYLPLIRR